MLAWKTRTGELYQRNHLRLLELWEPERSIEQQSETFSHYHQSVQYMLSEMHQEVTRLIGEDGDLLDEKTNDYQEVHANNSVRYTKTN